MQEEVKAISNLISDIIKHINTINVILKEANEDKAKEFTNTLQELLFKYIKIVNSLRERGYVIR